ncbi:MAG: protein kinase [Planctomycetota bacterium]
MEPIDSYTTLCVLSETRWFRVVRAEPPGGEGDDVVIKRPAAGTEDPRAASDMIAWENHVLERLAGGPVARALQHGTSEDGYGRLTLEFLDGIPLLAHARNRSMTDSDAALLFVAALNALQQIHEAGVVHGDLKPEHLIVMPDGTVRIIDFGLSAIRDAESPVGFLRPIRGGTRGYCAPELIEEPSALPTVQSDVYAMGMIARELFGVRGVSGGAVRRACALDYRRRWQTCREFSAVLDPERRRRRASRLLRYGSAAVITLVAGAVTATTLFNSPPPTAIDPLVAAPQHLQDPLAGMPTVAGYTLQKIQFKTPQKSATVSPDGTMLGCLAPDGHVELIGLDGRSRIAVGDFPGTVGITWGADSKSVLINRSENGVRRYFLEEKRGVEIETGEAFRVLDDSREDTLIGWSHPRRGVYALQLDWEPKRLADGVPLLSPAGGIAAIATLEDNRWLLAPIDSPNARIAMTDAQEAPVSALFLESEHLHVAISTNRGRCLVTNAQGISQSQVQLPEGQIAHALAFDQDASRLFAATATAVWVIDLHEPRLIGKLREVPTGVIQRLMWVPDTGKLVGVSTTEAFIWEFDKQDEPRLASR